MTQEVDPILSDGLEFAYEDTNVNIDAVITGPTVGDIFEQIYAYDITQTVNDAYNYGHLYDWSTRIKEQFSALINKKKIDIKVDINKSGLETILRGNFVELEKPAVDASLNIVVDDGSVSVGTNKEVAGQTFNYVKAISEVEQNLMNLEQKTVVLESQKDEPKITEEDIEEFVPLHY